MTPTAPCTETDELNKQRREIRAMLMLDPAAKHREVIAALYEIGLTDRRIDSTKAPERYLDGLKYQFKGSKDSPLRLHHPWAGSK